MQGACTALELAANGIEVDLFDKNAELMSQASLQNEGKVHLGYVYANDHTLRTARIMIAGALTFAPHLRRLLGPQFDRIAVSTPFYYLVHANSLLSADEVERHLHIAHQLYIEGKQQQDHDYFGAVSHVAPARVAVRDYAGQFSSSHVAAAFMTSELAIDPDALARLVRNRLAAEEKIRLFPRTKVMGVTAMPDEVAVEIEDAQGRHRETYAHAVNALWEGRLAVDATAGIKPDRPWLHRVKFFVRMKAPALTSILPSVTIVLGPFGDVVNYGTGEFYLSWYPAGMRGMSNAIEPPDWVPAPPQVARRVRHEIIASLGEILPAIGNLSPNEIELAEVMGGHIFAWGQTDIDDATSVLHERHAIGPRSYGHYHSIDTGKLTTAPLFAKQMADQIRTSMA